MSDPVTNAEVEDVLSSIRRLVSEDKRPVAMAKPAPQNDRLVLTPALRIEEEPVVKDDVTADQAAPTAPEEDAPVVELASSSEAYADAKTDHDTSDDQADATTEGASIDSAFEEILEDDYAMDPYNFDDETNADGESAAPLTLTPEARSDAEWSKPALAETQVEGEEQSAQTPQVAETKAATLSAKIEALESAIGGIEDDFEPDEVSTDAYSGTEPPALDWEQDLSSLEAPLEDLAPEEPSVDDTSTEDAPNADPQLSEAEDQDDTHYEDEHIDEPRAEEVFTARVTQETLQDVQEPVQEAAMAAAIAATTPVDDDQPFAFASDAPLIDEEALRDMVGEIVRSELQGALGERITRNVRKLVRREIHRALTTQDLE